MADQAAAPQPAGRDEAADTLRASRFGHARSARSAAILEDYTELIAELISEQGEARVTDIARRLGVTTPTANKSILRLKREGLATSRPYRGVFLTEAGHAMAERVRARHRLVVDLLAAVGVPLDAAEIDAEGIEHHISDTTLKAFERFLADPSAIRKQRGSGRHGPVGGAPAADVGASPTTLHTALRRTRSPGRRPPT